MIKKIAALGVPLLAGLAVTGLAVAVPAGAATLSPHHPFPSQHAPEPVSPPSIFTPPGRSAPATYSSYEIGYGAKGAKFRAVTMTSYLPKDVGQYASSYQPYAELYNPTVDPNVTPEVELIPTSNSSTPTDSWNPNGDDSSASATGFSWHLGKPYPKNSACYGNTDPRGCFYAGETVTLSVSYNPQTHVADMIAEDKANGDKYSAYLDLTSPLTLDSVDVGELWLAGFNSEPFVGPARPGPLTNVTGVDLTDNGGYQAPLLSWTHFKEIMTSNGTAHGTLEGEPGDLTGWGRDFDVFLR